MSTLPEESGPEKIIKLVEQRTDSISRLEIEESYQEEYEEKVTSRTIQRWLRETIEKGTIRSEGIGRAVRYFPTVTPKSETVPEETGTDYIKVSKSGAEIRDLIRRPIVQRKPVGFHPEFLFDYKPGKSFYLKPTQREYLHQIGRTPVGERPAGTYVRQILDRLLIDLSWASSRLEGNTYTRLDTKNLIEYGQRAEGKDAAEAQMILNHKNAIELLIEDVEEVGFNLFTFQNLHAMLTENLLDNPEDEGRIRSRMVQISGSVFTPLALPQQIEEFFRLLLQKVDAIPDPFEQAFFVMVHLPYLQPFIEGNKRVSRLGANLPLIKHNLCPLSFIDVPHQAYVEGLLGVYELNRFELLRDVFLWTYERSVQQYGAVKQSLGEPDPFRLRYRNSIANVINGIIVDGKPPGKSLIREMASDLVPSDDLDRFVEMTFGELLYLHEGNIVRYRLRPSDFLPWKNKWTTGLDGNGDA